MKFTRLKSCKKFYTLYL